MNYNASALQGKMLELQARAEKASTRQERLAILAEATVLQALIQQLQSKP